MKRIMMVAAMMVAIATGAFAQLLWKVTSPNGDKTSYVLGTHHFAPVSMLDSIRGLDAALKGADKLYGELDMMSMNRPENMAMMQKLMTAPQDSTIDKVLDATAMANLTKVWGEYGNAQVPLQALYFLKPAALSAQIAAGMAMKVLPPMDLGQGLDATMQIRANEQGKPVEGLETIEFQTNMIMGSPVSEQAADLTEMLADMDREADKAVKLTNAYLKQDYKQLENIVEEARLKDPAAQEKLIESRNITWVGKLVPEMKTTNLLVVVGAGHLVGKGGVLQRLRDAGFTVTEVR